MELHGEARVDGCGVTCAFKDTAGACSMILLEELKSIVFVEQRYNRKQLWKLYSGFRGPEKNMFVRTWSPRQGSIM
jgi:hypothetical protein